VEDLGIWGEMLHALGLTTTVAGGISQGSGKISGMDGTPLVLSDLGGASCLLRKRRSPEGLTQTLQGKVT
jgi:hypothetical protein